MCCDLSLYAGFPEQRESQSSYYYQFAHPKGLQLLLYYFQYQVHRPHGSHQVDLEVIYASMKVLYEYEYEAGVFIDEPRKVLGKARAWKILDGE